ncbi:MAG: transposase [Moheibacter sp.]
MDIRNTPIEPNKFYHIYNRGVNGEVIFKSDRNFNYFLNKVFDKLNPVCEVYAYCLLPNHFHLLVKIKSEKEVESLIKVLNLDKAEAGLHAPRNIFSKQFSKIFNSYSQAFNKENNRHGALIESPFKRKEINSEDYLRKAMIYIHQNPENHSIVTNFKNYKYSSFQTLIGTTNTNLNRNAAIQLFENKENFIFSHSKEIKLEEF